MNGEGLAWRRLCVSRARLKGSGAAPLAAADLVHPARRSFGIPGLRAIPGQAVQTGGGRLGLLRPGELGGEGVSGCAAAALSDGDTACDFPNGR